MSSHTRSLFDLPVEIIFLVLRDVAPIHMTGLACASSRGLAITNAFLGFSRSGAIPSAGFESETGRSIQAFCALPPGVRNAIDATLHVLPFPDIFRPMSESTIAVYANTMHACLHAASGELDLFLTFAEKARMASHEAGMDPPRLAATYQLARVRYWASEARFCEMRARQFASHGNREMLVQWAESAERAADGAGIPAPDFAIARARCEIASRSAEVRLYNTFARKYADEGDWKTSRRWTRSAQRIESESSNTHVGVWERRHETRPTCPYA